MESTALTRRLLTAAALLACALPAATQRGDALDKNVKQYVVHDQPRIRIDDVRVIDGRGNAVTPAQSVLLVDGRIARIGAVSALKDEKADLVIDGHGRSVMPGLVMMHEHLVFKDPTADVPSYNPEQFAAPKAYLAYGVTTMRTAGTVSGYDDLRTARMIHDGKFAGPDIQVTAPFIEGEGSFAYQAMPVTDAAGARKFVDFWADQGATSFKIYMNVTREVFDAVIDQAHKRGIHVTGHLCSITFREAAASGIDSLEHGISVASDFVKDKQPGKCPPIPVVYKAIAAADPDGAEMRAIVEDLVKHRVAVTSTLAVLAAGVVDWFPGLDDLRLLNYQSQMEALRTLAELYRSSPERREMRRKIVENEMRFERAFVAAGGFLMAGTDPTGWGGTVPGPGNHAEIRLLVEAGFKPLEAIRIATWNGARFQHMEDRIGSLEAGKQADLLLVDGKPDEDIKDLSKIDLVFKRGIAYDPHKLIDAARGKIGK